MKGASVTEGKNGKTKIAVVATAFSLLAGLTTAYNVYQDNRTRSIADQRNEQQEGICYSVNRLADSLSLILRLASVPQGGDTDEDIERRRQFTDDALVELEAARCEVTPIEP